MKSLKPIYDISTSVFHMVFFRVVALIVSRATFWAVAVLLAVGPIHVEAQPVTPPDVVKLPSGLDLGGSSFYDGFGRTDPGWVFIDYARWNALTSIRDNNGRKSPLFVDPRVDVFSNLFHVVYISPYGGSSGAFTVEALMPIVGFDSDFNSHGLVLRDNGWSVGDLTLGVDFQSPPIVHSGGWVLSWRAGIDSEAPTGSFNRARDLNQGSGFWSIMPYAAATVLPIPKWEISVRLSYDYNFSTERGADPPAIPGFTFRDGQAGQAAWLNFASSYETFEGIRPGVAGFWLQQFTDDRTNGLKVPSSRVDELYLGPGLSWQVGRQSVVNFNIYFPLYAANAPSGAQFNIQTIIRL